MTITKSYQRKKRLNILFKGKEQKIKAVKGNKTETTKYKTQK